MERIVIYKSKKKALILTVSSFLIALAGYLLIHYTGKEVVGWSIIILSIFILILGIGTFFDRKPKIILTPPAASQKPQIYGKRSSGTPSGR
ncbi:MAG: hypothetical protein LUH15_11520 [Tannerellaceae bacterium]|nr:hypothetical protein [Tannerellaceae bacterium]